MTLYKVTITRTVENYSPTWEKEGAIYRVEEEIKDHGFDNCDVTVEEVEIEE